MMKLFCLYMDELLAPLATEQDHKYDAFTSRYFSKVKCMYQVFFCVCVCDCAATYPFALVLVTS